MLNKNLTQFMLVSILLQLGSVAYAQGTEGLATLFTTPQERQIINANRYKRDKKAVTVEKTTAEPVAVRELIREEVKKSYRISGISINMDGSRTAWVNEKAFENNARLDDGSKLRINNGRIKSVSIIAPDGKTHTGTSGETVEVTYQRAIEE